MPTETELKRTPRQITFTITVDLSPAAELEAHNLDGDMASTEIDIAGLRHFRRRWQHARHTGSGIRAVALLNIDTDEWIRLIAAVWSLLPRSTLSHISRFEQDPFWSLQLLDAYGLFGPEGCNDVTFLDCLQQCMPQICNTAEDALDLLQQARSARWRVQGQGDVREWALADVFAAVRLAREATMLGSAARTSS